MRKRLLSLLAAVWLISALGWTGRIHAQPSLDSLTTILLDSLERLAKERVEPQDAEREARTNRFRTDTVSFYLIQRLEELTLVLDQNNRFLRNGLDSTGIQERLEAIKQKAAQADTILSVVSTRGNLKRQQLLRDGLRRQVREATDLQEELSRLNKKLLDNNRKIFLILNDSLMGNFPEDSVLQVLFLSQLDQLSETWTIERRLQRQKLLMLTRFQSELTAVEVKLKTLLSEVEDLIRAYDRSLLQRKETFLWQTAPSNYQTNFLDQVQRVFPSMSALQLYLRYDRNRYWWVSLLAGLLFALWVWSNRRQVRRQGLNWSYDPSYMGRHLWLVALFIGLFFIGIFEPYAPAYFKDVLFILLFLTASPLLLPHVPAAFRWVWPAMVLGLIFLRWFIDIGVPSFGERLILLVFGALGAIIGLGGYLRPYQHLFQNRRMAAGVTHLFTLSCLAGVALEFLGWHLLGKTVLYGGYYAVLLGLLLFLLVQFVNEAILLQITVLKKNTALSSFLHSEELNGPLYRVLFTLALILWIVATAIAYNFYDFGSGQLTTFLSRPRSLGNATFTFGSILIFIAVLWGASFLSRVIGEFYREEQSNPLSTGKGAQGSKLLLLRLAVLAVGFFVGLSAAGIPLTNLAIVLGALSVGIGFGLQNIVNNLISGIILAFEQPIRVGDTVEMGAVIGKVREIGIRSTKIAAYDGSELIVPNGDLIAQQIVNWTLSNNYRRLEVFIGVAYGSDVGQVRQIIQDVLQIQEEVFKYPEPSILTHELSDSSVVFRVLFWVRETSSWLQIKSEVVSRIYEQLRAQGVEIPYPKRDVYVHMAKGMKGASMAEDEDE